ncbi:hypothetical protein PsYK624_047750 [Phanerochaete sordida]|uniref:Uncharacterized protein n=1 Tax=Phanerochaete sordida TaxID=48140 RepID=A0A9P3LCB0_9APHY|nr:hypothetical protein PsYK624_047750 [Phanerochaete sordida]
MAIWNTLLKGASTVPVPSLLVHFVVAAVAIAIYRKQLAEVVAVWHANSPRVGRPAISAEPFQHFMRDCIKRYNYNTLASLATILSITVYLTIEEAKAQAEKHVLLQALAVLSLTYLVNGLILSMIFMDSLTHICGYYPGTLIWMEKQAAAPGDAWLSMPVVLSTPFTFTACGIITFVVFRAACAAISVLDLEDLAYRLTDAEEHYIAIGVVVYMVVMVIQTVLTAKAMLRTKTHRITVT